jgi:cobyric acid synthase
VYEVHNVQHKPKFSPIEPEPAHRVKLKNMLIKSKIMDLKEEFNKSEVASESLVKSSRVSSGMEKKEGEIWGDGFHLLSEGTQKAKEFIHRIKREQMEMRHQKSSKINQLKSLEVKSAMEHKEFE